MEHDKRGVHISAGDGIVAHVANLTAHAHGDEAGLNELLVRLNALAGEPWQEIVRTLTSGISDAGYDNHPAIACVSLEDDKVAALVFGDATLSVTIDGSETVLDGRDSSTWIDVALRGSVDRVHAGQQSESTVVGVLRDGVIPAGGFLLDTSGPIPASGRWSEIMAAPTETAAPQLALVVDQDAETAEPEVVAENAPAPEAPASAPVAAVATAAVAAAPALENPVVEEAAPVEPVEAPVLAVADAPDEVDSSPKAEAPDNESPAPAPTARSMFARIEEIGRAVSNEREQTSEELFSESPFEQRATPPSTTNGSEADSSSNESQLLALSRPQLKGVLCQAGHLTAPLETSCRTCGEPVTTGAKAATGDRPVLGTVTFDDGAVLQIDRPAAVGADVPTGYVIDGEPATIVRLDDGVGGVSGVQLEIRLSGWNVEIVDMNSENGTYTMLRGERQTRTKLRSGQSVVLQREMEVQTGGRSFVYTVGPTAEA